MRIGDLARTAGISADTARYYEKRGLLPRPSRSRNGYRDYGPDDLARVRLIRMAQALGFPLREIGLLIEQIGMGAVKREDVDRRINDRIKAIDSHIKRLRELRASLKEIGSQLSCAPDSPLSLDAFKSPGSGTGQPR